MSFANFFRKSKNIEKRSKTYLEEALYRKVFKEGGSEPLVRKQLNEFYKSSKRVYKWEVTHTLRKLRQRELYDPALKLSETMNKRGMNKNVGDKAIHLDLIAKVRGIPAAEEYFVNLPDSSKNHVTYGTLFNCYCQKLMVKEAEAIFEKMKELSFTTTSMPFNSLMTLYTKLNQHERIPEIIHEMKSNSIEFATYTYNVWMRALAALNDISGVERVIEEMNRKEGLVPHWTTYSNLASIYVDAGMFEKAEAALRNLEKTNGRREFSPFLFLITLYGRTNNIREVYRVWRSMRLAFPKAANVGYLNMIQALVNLNDILGAENFFEEWESSCVTYDIRIANVLIAEYAKQGDLSKAEKMKERAANRGAKANAKTWELFMNYYLGKGDYEKAVGCLRSAVSIGKENGRKWVPGDEVVDGLMANFEGEKDVEGAEALVETLKLAGFDLGVRVFEMLLRVYVSAGRSNSLMRRRLKMENVEVDEDLLRSVCPD